MALTTAIKSQIVKENQLSGSDTGSPEVQIALLTKDIELLTEHLKIHQKDVHSRRGLVHKVNNRRSLLEFLKKKDASRYIALIKKLGLRK